MFCSHPDRLTLQRLPACVGLGEVLFDLLHAGIQFGQLVGRLAIQFRVAERGLDRVEFSLQGLDARRQLVELTLVLVAELFWLARGWFLAIGSLALRGWLTIGLGRCR